MRTVTALAVLAAIAATPALAATTTASSWEGAVTEMQKQGPTSNIYGPHRDGSYIITNGYRHSYYRHGRYHRHYRGAWN